jgi:hypothetical protein
MSISLSGARLSMSKQFADNGETESSSRANACVGMTKIVNSYSRELSPLSATAY